MGSRPPRGPLVCESFADARSLDDHGPLLRTHPAQGNDGEWFGVGGEVGEGQF